MTIENDIRMNRIDKTKEAAVHSSEELDWQNLSIYKSENKILHNSDDNANRIVLMGDSITEGWSLMDPGFFKNNNLINRGISGQTSPQMLIRFKQDAVHLQPKLIIINAGTNDVAGNTGPTTPEMIIDNITSMVEIGLKNSIDVALSTILPVSKYGWNDIVEDAPERISKVNNALKKYAQEKKLLFINYYSALVNENKGMKSAYADDGVHPTKEGYEVMAFVLKNTLSGIKLKTPQIFLL